MLYILLNRVTPNSTIRILRQFLMYKNSIRQQRSKQLVMCSCFVVLTFVYYYYLHYVVHAHVYSEQSIIQHFICKVFK